MTSKQKHRSFGYVVLMLLIGVLSSCSRARLAAPSDVESSAEKAGETSSFYLEVAGECNVGFLVEVLGEGVEHQEFYCPVTGHFKTSMLITDVQSYDYYITVSSAGMTKQSPVVANGENLSRLFFNMTSSPPAKPTINSMLKDESRTFGILIEVVCEAVDDVIDLSSDYINVASHTCAAAGAETFQADILDNVSGGHVPVNFTATNIHGTSAVSTKYIYVNTGGGNVYFTQATYELDVTINQAASQADPTTTMPIYYDIVLSQSFMVDEFSFTVDDIQQNGTAVIDGWVLSNPSGDLQNFLLEINSIDGGGSIDLSIASGSFDCFISLYCNTESTSTDAVVEYVFSPPSVTSFVEPIHGTYSEGVNIVFQVNYDEAVVVTGVPRIAFDVGGNTRYATYVSGSGTAGLEFSYTVAAGESDLDGVSIATADVDLNGGTILAVSDGDAADSDFALFLDSMAAVIVDTSVPFLPPDQVVGVVTAPTLSGTDLEAVWTIPNDNGTAIVDYSVQYREQGTTMWLELSPAPTENGATITGLTAGLVYEIRVAANNGLLGNYSAVQTAGIFNVMDLNPIAWLSATNITNGGTEPSNGDKISQWEDLTGAATAATETNASRQPTYETNVLNGLPAVRFDNLDRGLEGTFTRAVGTDLTWVILGQFDTGSVNKCMFEFRGSGDARGFFIDERYAGNTHFSPAITIGNFAIWTIENSGNYATVTENFSTVHFDGLNNFNTDFIGTGDYVLGDDTTGNNRLNGYIAEFLVFDRALTAQEITVLENYLYNKWGL